MKTAALIALAFTATVAARADFSYSSSTKSPAGMPAGPSGSLSTVKHYLKGQKMKSEMGGGTSMIMDFDAQTMTSVNDTNKTYSVRKFSDLGEMMKKADIDAKIDFKETGQKKNINGYNSSQVIMSVEMESPSPQAQGMKMQMEMEMWISSDVPGMKEMKAFYQRNAGNFPWTALAGGGASNMQKTMAEVQKKVATLGGVPVQQITRMKPGGGAQAAQMQQGMEQARARLEAMAARGGPGADAAKQALGRMGGGAGGALFEVTTESSDFSTASIPDLIFAIPAGYTKVESAMGRGQLGAAPTPPKRP